MPTEKAATKPDVEKIIAVLEKEERGLCDGTLCERTPTGRVKKKFVGCFMGALLFHAGFPKESFIDVDSNLGIFSYGELAKYQSEKNEEARQLLRSEYGLSHLQIRQGMMWNDGDAEWTPQERRDHIIRKVREEWS